MSCAALTDGGLRAATGGNLLTDIRPEPTVDTGSRILALDGLRGITIILVVLGHLSSFLWPLEGIRSTPYLRGLVGGGAVTVFFIISGLDRDEWSAP